MNIRRIDKYFLKCNLWNIKGEKGQSISIFLSFTKNIIAIQQLSKFSNYRNSAIYSNAYIFTIKIDF